MLSAQNMTELREKGYTVVPGVISNADCDKYVKQYRDWLGTFGNKWPKSLKGLIKGYNTGHLDPTWQIRLKAKHVFAQIWKTDKLLTSFDAIAIGRPPEEGVEPYDDGSKQWLHLDQEGTRIGLHAYQGAVNLEEALEDDWTLQVMERSHKVFHKFFEQDKNAKRNIKKQFFKLNKTQIRFFTGNGCPIRRVPVPKGGMVLWESRIVHANAQPKEGRANPGRWRFAVFVSMTPAIWASEEDIEAKIDAYKNAKMTNHWSSIGSKATKDFGSDKKHPRKLSEIAKTKEAKLLAGAIPYDFEDGNPIGPPKPLTNTTDDGDSTASDYFL